MLTFILFPKFFQVFSLSFTVFILFNSFFSFDFCLFKLVLNFFFFKSASFPYPFSPALNNNRSSSFSGLVYIKINFYHSMRRSLRINSFVSGFFITVNIFSIISVFNHILRVKTPISERIIRSIQNFILIIH